MDGKKAPHGGDCRVTNIVFWCMIHLDEWHQIARWIPPSHWIGQIRSYPRNESENVPALDQVVYRRRFVFWKRNNSFLLYLAIERG